MPIPQEIKATIEDFILAYGAIETIELSNIEDSEETEVIRPRVQQALDDALGLLRSYETAASCFGSKVLIRQSLRRIMLVFARYFLDSKRRREDVYQDYKDALAWLDLAIKTDANIGHLSKKELADLGFDANANPGITWRAGKRVFTYETLASFRGQSMDRTTAGNSDYNSNAGDDYLF